ALTEKIKTEVEIPQHRSIYQIGETFGSRELIASYIGSGLLNAQFDFELYFSVRPVFALDAVSFTNASNSLRETFAYFGYHHLMGNITGNQDMARFISYASGDLKFDENDKEAGWQRDIEVTDTIGYARLKMLQAFNMTIPGIPIIYYGDEIGMPGANDPDNRRMMRFEKLSPQELSVRNTVSRLTHIRSEHMALLYGDIEILSATDDILVYRRTYFSDVVYVFFNKSRSKNVIQIPASWHLENGNAQFGAAYDKAKAAITLGPVSFEVITIDK
ncbi:MAG: alpha-amylase family glycosyl hydrolase, partial [Chitinophagales bacterium]